MSKTARISALARKLASDPHKAKGNGKVQSLPMIEDAADFVASVIDTPRELVRGVVHCGSKLCLGGGSKSFKTWTLLDLAISVACGVPWLDMQTNAGRVLYVNFEIPAWSWQSRLKQVTQAKGVMLLPDQLSVWNLRGYGADYRLLLPEVRRTVRMDFALIILDPIYKLYGGTDENKAGDVAALLNSIEDLATTSGAAVAFGAHFSKGNQSAKESIDRISGSGVFARDPDSLLVFTRHEEENAFTVEATLRNYPPLEPFVARWDFPRFVRDPDLDPNNLKNGPGPKPKHELVELLSAISDTTLENPVSISSWADRLGMPRTTLAEYVPGMRAKSWISTVSEGSRARQFITATGLAMLKEKNYA